MATLASLETDVQLLTQRLNKLPTQSQVTELQNLLNTYKSDTDAALIQTNTDVNTIFSRLQDIEARLQALEP